MTLWMLLVGVAVSVFFVNRQTHWDAMALYYVGSYGLGALAFWVRQAPGHKPLLVGAAVMVGLALLLDWRLRLLLALLTMLVLCMKPLTHQPPLQVRAWLTRLSDASYGQFLTHFLVVMAVNALAVSMPTLSLGRIATWMLLGILLSLGLGLGFNRFVEQTMARVRVHKATHSLPSHP